MKTLANLWYQIVKLQLKCSMPNKFAAFGLGAEISYYFMAWIYYERKSPQGQCCISIV